MALQDLTPQLRTRLKRVERLVTLFVVVATILLVAGFAYYLYHTAERKGWFTPKVTYYTMLMTAEGLAVGDPVVMMGFSVGEVTRIEAEAPYSYYGVYIEFAIRRPYYGYIWTDSKLKIASAGFLGARRLEIVKGFAGKPTVREQHDQVTGLLVDNDYISPAKAKAIYLKANEDTALTERAEKLLTQVEAALPNILSLTNRLNTVLDNASALTSNANVLVTDARPVVTNLTGQLDRTFANVNVTITNANSQLTLLAGNLNATLLNLANITSNLNVQVQSNDQILSEISDLVRETDDMLQGLKRHWLLKGAFPEPPPQPNLLLQPSTGNSP